MSGGYMSTSIKNNLSLLSKREKLKNTLGSKKNTRKTEYNLPKASNKELSIIARRMQEEHRLRMAKVMVVTAILFFILVAVFLASRGGIVELLTY
ncbi:hypothetical protein [Winogradskyella algicola]|uniref:hypothetical protein n=1 Tax=Winogradskyella algicola TaxID=2575815 RepID=UPI0011089BFB|nr:hypothetical protein [Winogradskyella algicola]